MTRGRKKDFTIPPTRNLVQQRDYRARKARYLSDLEERCKSAEEENVRLRKELAETKARLNSTSAYLPETSQSAAELLKTLDAASSSISKFQQLLSPDPATILEGTTQDCGRLQPREPLPHRGVRLPPITALTTMPDATRFSSNQRPLSEMRFDRSSFPTIHSPSNSSSSSRTECCGPYFDCDEPRDEGTHSSPKLSGSGSDSSRSTSLSFAP